MPCNEPSLLIAVSTLSWGLRTAILSTREWRARRSSVGGAAGVARVAIDSWRAALGGTVADSDGDAAGSAGSVGPGREDARPSPPVNGGTGAPGEAMDLRWRSDRVASRSADL